MSACAGYANVTDGPDGEDVGSGVCDAFQRFVAEHYQATYRFAFKLAGNHHGACDLTQHAFYIAQTNGHQLRDSSKGKEWLFCVLRRKVFSNCRHASAHQEATMESAETSHIHEDKAAALDVMSALSALDTLDAGFKAPLHLFYVEELSYKTIAETLKLPIGTVMSRLARGKVALRQVLEEKHAPAYMICMMGKGRVNIKAGEKD